MPDITLVELEIRDRPAGLARTLRFAQHPGPRRLRPRYDTRLLTAGSWERHLFAPGQIAGPASTGAGTVQLANADGALDGFLLDRSAAGRRLTIRRGDRDATDLSDFATLFDGTIGGAPELTWDTVTLPLASRRAEIAAEIVNRTLYAGTGETEGSEANLKGQNKPLLLGVARNFAPVPCDPAKRIWQITDKPRAFGQALVGDVEILGVWDRGSAINAGSEVTSSLAALQSNSPTGGTYDWYDGPEGAYIQLGSAAQGEISVDARESAAADRTVAQIARRILLFLGVPDGEILGVRGLDGVQGGEAGYWTGTAATDAGTILDFILGGAGASWRDRRDGSFFLERLELPDADGAAVRLTRRHVGEPRFLGNRAIPDWRVAVEYRRNWQVQDAAALAGIATSDPARVAALSRQWRVEASETAARRTADRLATVASLQTPFDAASVAAAEAARQLAMRAPGRVLQLPVLDMDRIRAVDLGDNLILDLPRFGLDGGKAHRVLGIRETYGAPGEARSAELILWGVY